MRYYTAQMAKQIAKKAKRTRFEREINELMQTTKKQARRANIITAAVLFCVFASIVAIIKAI